MVLKYLLSAFSLLACTICTETCDIIELSGLAGTVIVNKTILAPLNCHWIIVRNPQYTLLQFQIQKLTFAPHPNIQSTPSHLATTTPVLETTELVVTPNTNSTIPPTPSTIHPKFLLTTDAPSESGLTSAPPATTKEVATTADNQPPMKPTQSSSGRLLLHEGMTEADPVILTIDGNATRQQQVIPHLTLKSGFLVHVESNTELLSLQFSYLVYNIPVPGAVPATCPYNGEAGDQFLCDGRKCLSANLTCDGQRECDDGSDESSCGTAATKPGGSLLSVGVVVVIVLLVVVVLVAASVASVLLYRRLPLKQHQDLDTIRMTEECEEDNANSLVPDTLLAGPGYGTTQQNGRGPAVFEVTGLNVYI